MTREEYLNARFKRDFIKHVLLQKPRFTDAEISKKLKSNIDADSVYDKMKALIPGVLDKYLSAERIKDSSGEAIDILPNWLNPGIADAILKDCIELIEKEYSSIDPMPSIMAQIERLTWAQGVDDMAHNLERFVGDIRNTAVHYCGSFVGDPSTYEINEKYEAAKRVTLRERITHNNHKDILDFLLALRAYCQDLCATEVIAYISKLYKKLADSTEINGLIERFKKIQTEAIKELLRLEATVNNSEWDKEYSAKIPTEFYERNVEDIDATGAFQMALLQALANHEESLKQQGYLSDEGEFVLFTNQQYDGLRWQGISFDMLFSTYDCAEKHS